MNLTIETIVAIRRLINSESGNPRFRVVFTDQTVRVTASDYAVASAITGEEDGWVGKTVHVQVNRRGQIISMHPIAGPVATNTDNN